jgi:F-type H+-transporting ATPase subunit delta
MIKETHNSPLALSYAQALLDLAGEAGTEQATGAELADVRKLIDDSPDFHELLANRGIGEGDREGLLVRIFDGRVSPLLMNFLKLVNTKGRAGMIGEMSAAYDDLLDAKFGKIEVDVTVAHRLDDAQVETVRQKVSAAINRDAVIHQYVDDSIIGGLILRVQDKLIDGSVRAQLDRMRRRLLEAAPK